MRYFFTLTFLTLFFTSMVHAQDYPRHKIINLSPKDFRQSSDAHLVQSRVKLPWAHMSPQRGWAISWPGSLEEVFTRRSEKERWQSLQADAHYSTTQRQVSSLYFFGPEQESLEIALPADQLERIAQIKFFLTDPGVTPENLPRLISRQDTCLCPEPPYEERLDWCPSGNCPPDPTPQPTDLTHLIVHHSAGVNVSNDWPAIVRSIWDFHVNFNGWDDIGYNWLIDPNGVLYEGRGEGLQGAHFCGTNGNTSGLCMLGTYTDVLPTIEARERLVQFLGWQAGCENIPPLGESFHASSGLVLDHISGHRDGCATECPGETFYATFPLLRQEVKMYTDTLCPIVTSLQHSAGQEPDWQLYPNPAKEHWQLSWQNLKTGSIHLELRDLSGRLIRKQKWQLSTQQGQRLLDAQGLPPGNYLLHLRSSEGEWILKAVRR